MIDQIQRVSSGKQRGPIGPLQLRIMDYIWDHGDSTVHDVHDHLSAQEGRPQLAYTTVLTVMRNLVRRQILSQNPSFRNHVFKPLVTRDEYCLAMLQEICTDFFSGDDDAMVAMIQELDVP